MNKTDNINTFWNYLNSQTFISSAIVIIIAIVLMYVIKQFLIKKVAYTGKKDQHKNTYIGVIFNVLQYVVLIAATVIVLKINGVDVGSILTGLGLLGMIIGLALQDTLKDIIAGLNIYNNNFYKVGDMVRYNGEECDVKYFNARVTKFQSINTNSTYTVCNSTITSIEKIKDRGIARYLFSFDTEKKIVDECMETIVDRSKKEIEHIKDIYYDGINDISTIGVRYELKYQCPAHKAEEVRDAMAEISYEQFKTFGISPVFSSLMK